MPLSRLVLIAIGASIGAFGWAAWPIYGFMAFGGDAPLPPVGWLVVPQDAPSDGRTQDRRYAAAGAEALAALETRRARIGAPAMSAAVAIDGEVVWAAAVGWADLPTRTPATPDTIFRVGSTSKALTATALARMVDRGTIDLDAPLATYMPDPRNPGWATITPRQLASHTAGIAHYGDNTDGWGKLKTAALNVRYEDVRDALDVFDGSEMLFAPGEGFSYSSLGTVLLGAVMSEAAGEPYRAVMAAEVFEPADAASTIVSPRRSSPTDDIATPYYLGDGRVRAWRAVDLSHRLPGGGWASTPTDLVRIGALWFDEDFITPETRAEFWTPQRLNDGAVNEQNYAVGWRWRDGDGSEFWLADNANHGGVSRGGQCWLLIFPEDEMVLAFATNVKTEDFVDFGQAYADLYRAFVEE